MLTNLQRTYTYWCACEDKIARLEHEELAHIGYYLIYSSKHLRGMSFLYGIAVDVEMETDVLYMRKSIYGDEVA